MIKKLQNPLLALVLISILGLLLRLYRLDQNIPELYTDEVGHYYYLEHLKNHTAGPIKELSYLFFTASWFAGLNPLGVRLFSALFGSLVVLIGFYFAKVLAKEQTKQFIGVGLIYSLLLALLPWNFAISRLAHTHVPIVVFAGLLHLYLYLRATSPVSKLISFVPFLIGSYYYPTLILMSPLTLLVPAKELIWDNHKYRRQVIVAGVIFGLIVTSFMINKYQVTSSESRGLDLAIWRDVNVTADSNLYRGLARDSQPSIFSFGQNPENFSNKVLFNFPISVINNFFKNYLSFFSVENLFLRGDTILRHSTGMVGNFYLGLLPFMIYGAFSFFSSKIKTNTKWLLGLWLVASPVPAAITKDGANYLLRAIALYPILTYFCALGIMLFVEKIQSKSLKILSSLALVLIFGFSVYSYFFGYFHVYPSLAKDSFEYGFKELSDFQKETNATLLITWEDKYPYSQFCFWQKLPITVCDLNKTDLQREMVGDSRVDYPLEKVIFSLPENEKDLKLIIEKYQPQYLALSVRFAKNYQNFFAKMKPIKTINNPDGSVSFYLFDLKNYD